MHRAQLIRVVGIRKDSFNTLRREGQLPFHLPRHDGAARWHRFTLDDAFRLRLQLELMGRGSALEVGSGALPSFAPKAVANALSKRREGLSFDVLRSTPEDLYAGFLVFDEPASPDQDLRRFGWFFGCLEDVARWRDGEIEAAEQEWRCREALCSRVVLANASAAARHVHRRAVEIGALEEG